MTLPESVIERFWKYCPSHLPKDVCWPWAGSVARKRLGYGQLSDKPNKTVLKAHRVSYEITYGEIAPGFYICHRCDNPVCVNPAHLYAGTARDNHLDMVARGQHIPPPLRQGERSGRARVTNEQARYIRESNRRGVDLAKEFGVAQTTISAIRNGQNWKWL